MQAPHPRTSLSEADAARRASARQRVGCATPRVHRRERAAVVDAVAVERDAGASRPRPRARAGERELLGVGDQHADARGRGSELAAVEHRRDAARVVERSRVRVADDRQHQRQSRRATSRRARPPRGDARGGARERQREQRDEAERQCRRRPRPARSSTPAAISSRDARRATPSARRRRAVASRFTPRRRMSGDVEHARADPSQPSAPIASARTTTRPRSVHRTAIGARRRPGSRAARSDTPTTASPTRPGNAEYSNGCSRTMNPSRAQHDRRSSRAPRRRRRRQSDADCAPSRARCGAAAPRASLTPWRAPRFAAARRSRRVAPARAGAAATEPVRRRVPRRVHRRFHAGNAELADDLRAERRDARLRRSRGRLVVSAHGTSRRRRAPAPAANSATARMPPRAPSLERVMEQRRVAREHRERRPTARACTTRTARAGPSCP